MADDKTIRHIVQGPPGQNYHYDALDLFILAVELAFIIYWFGPDLARALRRTP